jgi:glutathione S-transferase
MKLIGSTTSPYVRKVRIVLAEKKIEADFVLENVLAPETTIGQTNPLGKIPCLVMDDGSAVFDSRVIVEYVDTLSPVGKLIPADGRERAAVKTWEALADGLLDAGILTRYEATLRPAEQQSPAWVERQMSKIDAALKSMSIGLGESTH